MSFCRETKKNLILNSALKVFAVKGYHYATVDDIAKDAGIAKGSVHAYFENKLDLLLTLMLTFWQNVNAAHSVKGGQHLAPLESLKEIFDRFQEMLLHDTQSLYWGKILREGLPDTRTLKSEKLQGKLLDIDRERKKLIQVIDDLILQSQSQGLLKKTVKAEVIRQILGGASQLLVYGLFMKFSQGEGIGYDGTDVRKAMHQLIESFCVFYKP